MNRFALRSSGIDMVTVSERFHEIAARDPTRTRVRIYFIDETVDCTDDTDVQTNGTLLRWDENYSDSSRRIDMNGGLSVVEQFNKDDEVTIGQAVSSTLSISFNNSDGGLNSFAYGRCKVYIDAYDAENEEWLPCPLGVFNINTPIKRRLTPVSATAYDQMDALNVEADDWWNNLDFDEGLTLSEILSALATAVGVKVHPDTLANMVNGSYVYTQRPFDAVSTTYRDILGWIAGAAAAVARFDRNGYLTLKFFTEASYNVSVDTSPTVCFSYNTAEYAVAVIDKLQVAGSESDVGVIIGTGTNAYRLIDNRFMYGATVDDITSRANNIYTVLNGLAEYTPISLDVNADWSVEAGDIVPFTMNKTTYALPIFQQTLTWHTARVRSVMYSSGNPKRQELSLLNRYEYQSRKQIHELEITAEQLRSYIQDLNGNYSQILQTISTIEQVVSSQGTTLSEILDPDGVIWTQIKSTQGAVDNLSDAVEADQTERETYMRFIAAEPALVLGIKGEDEVKLKLVNKVIYFFSGQDDSTDLSNAYASFDSEQVTTKRVVASEAVQIGYWRTGVLANRDLAIDFLG